MRGRKSGEMSIVRAAGLLVYRLFNGEIQYLMLRTSYGERHWTPPKGEGFNCLLQ